jgi:hypothetical protein
VKHGFAVTQSTDTLRRRAKRGFTADLLDLNKWFLAAADLLASAELLEPSVRSWWRSFLKRLDGSEVETPERRVQRVYFMLLGFAVENLCKAVLIKRLSATERVAVRKDGTLPSRFKTHDLFELLSQIGFPLDEFDDTLIPRLETASQWYGRYPVPVHASKRFLRTLPGGTEVTTALYASFDPVQAGEFIERLKKFSGFKKPKASLLDLDA